MSKHNTQNDTCLARITKNIEHEIQELLNDLTKAISDEFHIDPKDLRLCIDQCIALKPDKPKKADTEKARKPKKPKTNETCCAELKNGKTCGKKASTEHESKWYCGVHIKSTSVSKPKTKRSLAECERIANQRSKSLVDRIVKSSFDSLDIVTLDNGRRMDSASRILFHGNKAYGKLGEETPDQIQICPLDDKDVRFLDGMGIEQCPIPQQSQESEEEEEEEQLEFD